MDMLIKVFDSGEDHKSRYTIITNHNQQKIGKSIICDAISLNEVNDVGWIKCVEGKHLGQRIYFKNLPQSMQDSVVRLIKSRERKILKLNGKTNSFQNIWT